jgi:hypothetical protein
MVKFKTLEAWFLAEYDFPVLASLPDGTSILPRF